jgi:HK97 family phage major capsid protein
MTLQEMREARKNLQAELTKMNSTVTERRSAGKSGADLWTAEEQTAFDKLTGDIGKLDGDISSEERAEGLTAHMSRMADDRNRATNSRGQQDPRLTDRLPGSDLDYGDRYSDRDSARAHARGEENRSLAFHAYSLAGRNSNLITDRHRQAIADLKIDMSSNSLEFRSHDNATMQRVRSIFAGGDVSAERRSQAWTALESRSVQFDANKGFIPDAFINSFEIGFSALGDGVLSLCDMIITSDPSVLPFPGADDQVEGFQIDEAQVPPVIPVTADPEIYVPRLGVFDYSSGIVKLSKSLLANSPMDWATTLGALLGERLNRAIERKVTFGTRVNQPGGYVTKGVLAGTVPLAAPVALASLQKLVWSLISKHRQKATLALNDLTLSSFASLVDGENRPLLNIGSINGQSVLQIGRDVAIPYKVTNFLKSPQDPTLAVGDIPIVFGNFSAVKVRMMQQIRLQRMVELYAVENMDGWAATRGADADVLKSSNAATAPVKYLQVA